MIKRDCQDRVPTALAGRHAAPAVAGVQRRPVRCGFTFRSGCGSPGIYTAGTSGGARPRDHRNEGTGRIKTRWPSDRKELGESSGIARFNSAETRFPAPALVVLAPSRPPGAAAAAAIHCSPPQPPTPPRTPLSLSARPPIASNTRRGQRSAGLFFPRPSFVPRPPSSFTCVPEAASPQSPCPLHAVSRLSLALAPHFPFPLGPQIGKSVLHQKTRFCTLFESKPIPQRLNDRSLPPHPEQRSNPPSHGHLISLAPPTPSPIQPLPLWR